MNYINEAVDILNESGWVSDIKDNDDLWYGTDNIDVNVFLTEEVSQEQTAKVYKYGVDIYDCKLDDKGYIVTKEHLYTIFLRDENDLQQYKCEKDNVTEVTKNSNFGYDPGKVK